ncbi:tautomerase family protein [Galbitalea sp. SE-J8]|uniref:tautomerase family protein n=1 Tax=Galbitalea sp. SE-J8 TaxID=3054952 RepID=UPI00259D2DF8|nr:tautomerase family protein [Galbitalea sp. SE-J8]MDM4762995.1 tautomerase family protein [Galbitalea sp. SE-J8]
MPIITVDILHGRTPEQRRVFAEDVTAAAVRDLGADRERVIIRFQEHGPFDVATAGRFRDDQA